MYVVAIDEPLDQVAVRVAEDDLEALLADPLRGLEGGRARGGETGDTGAGGQVCTSSRASGLGVALSKRQFLVST